MTATQTGAIDVTPKAVTKIREAFAKHGVSGGLRLGVLGGGCSGLSYQFKFDTKPRATDSVFEFDNDDIDRAHPGTADGRVQLVAPKLDIGGANEGVVH